MIGSYYGEDIYSAELYSWETAWEGLACAPITRVPNYVPPPAVVWPGMACAAIPRNVLHMPPVANWDAAACQPLTKR